MVTLGLSVDSKVLGLVLSHEIRDKLESRRCLQCGMQYLLMRKFFFSWGVLVNFYGVGDLIMIYND